MTTVDDNCVIGDSYSIIINYIIYTFRRYNVVISLIVGLSKIFDEFGKCSII